MALERIDWPRSDPRWYSKLENTLYVHRDPDRALLLAGFRLTLNRCDPNVPGSWGTTILHAIAASRGGLTAVDRLSFATPVLDAGGRLDLRDNLLKSTPLGWACRWGRIELVRLFLERRRSDRGRGRALGHTARVGRTGSTWGYFIHPPPTRS